MYPTTFKHATHNAGIGTPSDETTEFGAISAELAPKSGELVVVKNYLNSFWHTNLEAQLKALGG